MIKELIDKLSEWITGNPICGSNEEKKGLNKKSAGGLVFAQKRDGSLGPDNKDGKSKDSSQVTSAK